MRIGRPNILLLFTAGLFFPYQALFAQTAAEDSTLYHAAVNNMIALYHTSQQDQSGLYNGPQHGGYHMTFEAGGIPYFKENKIGRGAVVYDGLLYEHVMLQYDQILDVVVMEDSTHRIQLIKEKTDSFTIFENNFVRIERDSQTAVLVRSGFYNLLYNGKTSLLKREEKFIRDDPGTGVLQHFIEEHQYYYLKKNNSFHAIKSKAGLLDILGDKKKELKQYIRKNKLNYRKDRDNMLAKTVAWYDQLTN